MNALDRDAAREKLWPLWDSAQMDDGEVDLMLNALEGCVRPAPRQTIDRAKALKNVEAALVAKRAGFRTGMTETEVAVDTVIALLRPVDGVTLTRHEAQRVLEAADAVGPFPASKPLGEDLASRLEDYVASRAETL